MQQKINNHDRFKSITQQLYELWADKNTRYQDSFTQTLNKYGLVAALTRIEDKINRLEYLLRGCRDGSIGPGIRWMLHDTINDAINYLIMTKMWLETLNAESNWEHNWKEIKSKILGESCSKV